MNQKVKALLYSLVLQCAGLFIICTYAGWKVALGIFLFQWGGNVEKSIKNKQKHLLL
jgi:hypothetical protein